MTENPSCSDAAFFASFEGFELFPHIVRGRSVDIEELAAAADWPAAQVEHLARSQPGTYWDDDGRLVGFGLSLRPTDHHFTIGGRTLYTWCAADTLIFTVILEQPAIAESTCPTTGQAIRVELAPDAVLSVSPPEAVISQRHGGDLLGDIRAQVCDQGHFYASAAAAEAWAAEHPEGEVLSVSAAFDRCREACQELGWVAAGRDRPSQVRAPLLPRG